MVNKVPLGVDDIFFEIQKTLDVMGLLWLTRISVLQAGLVWQTRLIVTICNNPKGKYM